MTQAEQAEQLTQDELVGDGSPLDADHDAARLVRQRVHVGRLVRGPQDLLPLLLQRVDDGDARVLRGGKGGLRFVQLRCPSAAAAVEHNSPARQR